MTTWHRSKLTEYLSRPTRDAGWSVVYNMKSGDRRYGVYQPDKTFATDAAGEMYVTRDSAEVMQLVKKLSAVARPRRDISHDRSQVLHALRGRPFVRALQVAEAVGKDEAAVRRDLDVLVREGLVEVRKSTYNETITRGPFAARGASMKRKVSEYRLI